jgi:hypothetical protein
VGCSRAVADIRQVYISYSREEPFGEDYYLLVIILRRGVFSIPTQGGQVGIYIYSTSGPLTLRRYTLEIFLKRIL